MFARFIGVDAAKAKVDVFVSDTARYRRRMKRQETISEVFDCFFGEMGYCVFVMRP